MPVVHCPSCRQPLTVAAGLGGTVLACPHCQNLMTLPDAPAARAAAHDRAPAGRGRWTTWTPIVLVGAAAVLGLVGALVVVVVLLTGGKPTAAATGKAEPAAKADRPAPAPKAKADPAPAAGGRMDDGTVARIKRATVYIRVTRGKQQSSGSGFFVDKGKVVTNHHVINPGKGGPADKIEVVVESGTAQAQTFPATVLGQSPEKDLAVLDVPGATGPAPLAVGDTAALRETHDAYAFGFPLGERLGEEITVTKTTVSSLRRGPRGQEVQLNGGLHPGNSGGPVTDSTGRVVGVAVAVIQGTQIHFAIAGEEVQTFLARNLDR